jgi:hypothetical protein
MQNDMTNGLARLPGAILLVSILLTSAFATSFLLNRSQINTVTSLVPDASSPEALVETLKKLSPQDRSVRIAEQIGNLTAEPLNLDVINNIALLEALGENPKNSESIVVESARRSLRDVQSQLSAVNILLGKREYSKAMFHIDGLLRSRPKLSEQVFKVLSQLQQIPEGMQSIAALLNENPPWRAQYLGAIYAEDATGKIAFQLLATIRKAGGKVTDNELRDYIGTQITKKNDEIAYFTWLDSLDEESLRSAALLFDGKFDRIPRNQYFDWTVIPYPNAKIGVAAKPSDPLNKVLSVEFLGGREAFANVRQFLKLQPGEYEVSGEWIAENFQSPSGLSWQVYCLRGAASSPPSALLGASGTWDKFSFPVTIPPENCETQLLQLQSASSAALDQRFEGQMYFDNIVVANKSPTPKESGEQ